MFSVETSRGEILPRCTVSRGRFDDFTDGRCAQCKTNMILRCKHMYSTITTMGTTCDARICDAGVLCCQKRQMDCAGPEPNDVMRTPKTTDDMPGGILLQDYREHAKKKRKYRYTTCDNAPLVCLLPGLPGPHWPGAVAMRGLNEMRDAMLMNEHINDATVSGHSTRHSDGLV